MADLAAMRARASDPATFVGAQARMDAIRERIDFPAIERALTGAFTAASPKAKVLLLREASAHLGRAAAPLVPCQSGCTHCCKMPALIGAAEAAQIARETGARLASPPLGAGFNPRYSGVDCTFLGPTGCTIYAHRPFACRIHYTVDRDPLLCEIVPGAPKMPMFNTMELDIAYVKVFSPNRDPAQLGFADVRDFFPQGARK